MNQYTALCPQAFEYLTPGKLQRAATGSQENIRPETHATRTNSAGRSVFKQRDQDVQKSTELHIQFSRETYPFPVQLTSRSERRLCADHYRCPCARCWPVSDQQSAADLPSRLLHFRLFGHFECVVDFDTEISNGALSLEWPNRSCTARKFLVRR